MKERGRESYAQCAWDGRESGLGASVGAVAVANVAAIARAVVVTLAALLVGGTRVVASSPGGLEEAGLDVH